MTEQTFNDEFFAAEELIVDKIKEITEFIRVASVSNLGDVKDNQQQVPACYVMYAGEDVGESVKQAATPQRTVQKWYVIVAVRNVDQQDKKASRSAASPLVSLLLAKLAGYKPFTNCKPLARRTAPVPAYLNGFAYFPFRYDLEVITP